MFHNFIHLTNLSYIILNFIQYTEELKAEKVSNAALDKAVDDVKNEASAMTETMPTERRLTAVVAADTAVLVAARGTTA